MLCLECWNIFNYEQKTRHLQAHPTHRRAILTSKDFASEQQIIALSNAQSKFVERDGQTFIVAPFLKSANAFSCDIGGSRRAPEDPPSCLNDRRSLNTAQTYALTNKRLQKLERKTRSLESHLRLLCSFSLTCFQQNTHDPDRFSDGDRTQSGRRAYAPT